MNPENVDALRAVYAGWRKGNYGLSLTLYDPLVLFIPFPDFPAAAYYLGPDAITEFMRGFLAAWTKLTMTAEEFIEAGDSIVVATRWRGVGKESGALTERQVFDVWSFRGPLVTRVEFFSDRSDALEAVGLPRDS
jgi:ketosteroid isomerase-like protein